MDIRRGIRRLWAAALVLLLLLPAPVFGENRADALIAELISYNMKASGQADVQGWIDTALKDGADGTGGWYLIALRQHGEGYDWSACREALERKAEETGTGSMTKRLRMSLTLLSLGSGSAFPAETAAMLRGDEPLMTAVFALHLFNNGVASDACGAEEMLRRLLDLQLADGGWAVIGEACDVDCTAMALQALAPYYGAREQVTAAADAALAALSARQLPNGGFTGMGMESAESCAQGLLALSSLGINCEKDGRFIRDGNTVLDAMLRFRTEDGGFAHAPGGAANATATVQAFYSLAGYSRLLRGEGPYYVLDRAEAEGRTAAPALPVKGWLYLAIGLGTAAACLVSVLRKKRNIRTYLFIAAVGILLAAAVFLTEVQSPEKYYAPSAAVKNGIATTVSVRCDSVAGRSEYAPADGVILDTVSVLLPEGATAFDQLLEATRANRLQMEYDGTTAGAYVEGIGYLYEYAFGNLSGWLYRVNGAFADVGCSQYRLQEGDAVEWMYTTDLGKDVGNNYMGF